MQKVSLGYSGL